MYVKKIDSNIAANGACVNNWGCAEQTDSTETACKLSSAGTVTAGVPASNATAANVPCLSCAPGYAITNFASDATTGTCVPARAC